MSMPKIKIFNNQCRYIPGAPGYNGIAISSRRSMYLYSVEHIDYCCICDLHSNRTGYGGLLEMATPAMLVGGGQYKRLDRMRRRKKPTGTMNGKYSDG